MSYLLSICVVLAIPAALLGFLVRRRVDWRAFGMALLAISVIGAAWSAVVTANGWWSFSSAYVSGLRFLSYLLVEELAFYPAGGALCIMLYIAAADRPARPMGHWYFAYVAAGLVVFGAVAFLQAEHRPMYLYSQLVVYNILVGGTLTPLAAQRIDWRGWTASTSVMAVLGYSWDHIAFTRGWWDYHAITAVRFGAVPIDDCAFFLYAPAAAIALYESSVWLRLGVLAGRRYKRRSDPDAAFGASLGARAFRTLQRF